MKGLLQIKVLGELVVLRDAQEIVLAPSKKTRALLAYLAVVNRRQQREYLCQMFWDAPDDPRASLRWSLSKLRRLISENGDDPCFRTDRSSVLLDTDKLDVDWRHVAQITAKDVRSLATSDLETLAAKFRGRFLEGLELPRCPVFEAWRTFHADALDRTRSLILQTLIERLRSEPERALSYAHVLQSMDPTNEQVSLEIRSLATSAQSQATRLRSASEESGRHDDDLPDARVERSQEIRYCRNPDGVQIAFAISGRGPPILRAAHWMSHLQLEWESPVWRHWIDSLSRENTLIRYDERGNGLSDWDADDLSFAAMVSDLESIADASGLNEFSLLGVSQSCALSVAYAVRHPERVSRLVLYGGYARGWRKRGDRHEIDTHEAMTTLIREGWGRDNPAFRQLFTETFIPGARSTIIETEIGEWRIEMKVHSVIGGGGVKLHVREWGKADAPAILFIHGWSQNHLCWNRQYESVLADAFRLVAFDLRGHGMSEAPEAQERYTHPQAWADDIAAIIAQLGLEHPVLVGWSYGGFVICDYLRSYGQDAVAGINFVSAAVTLDMAAFGVLIGPGFIDHVPGATADDFPSNIQAIRAFVHGCTAHPLPRDEYEMALCWNIMVPPKVRAALIARVIDSDDVLSALERPVLVTHGGSDTVILPAMGERILKVCRTSTASWYPKTGHAPFLEESPRFNSELADFVRKTRA